MRFFHISDLHLGKRVHEVPMINDQSDILRKIVLLARDKKPDAVLIAGDVYDKSMPTVEAVQLLDRFLVWLNDLGITVFMISGNHDSVERVAFGADLLKYSDVHIVQSYRGQITPVSLNDEHGSINVWMLPYLKPALVRRELEKQDIVTYAEALAAALSEIKIDSSQRNVLIAHQFVTGAVTSESEEYVGGSENVDGSLFDAFDYVALGHLHRPQHIERETLRYCGSPLKYSFSEVNDQKSVTVVDMGQKGEVVLSELPLEPAHEMRVIRGTYNELMNRSHYRGTNTDDYVRIILTDEHEEPDARRKLDMIYKNLMCIEYDNTRTKAASSFTTAVSAEIKTPARHFGDLFEMQNGQPMNGEQTAYVANLFHQIFEEANT
jgi:exonuclease SbcD